MYQLDENLIVNFREKKMERYSKLEKDCYLKLRECIKILYFIIYLAFLIVKYKKYIHDVLFAASF